MLQRFSPAMLARCLPFALFIVFLSLRVYLPAILSLIAPSYAAFDVRWVYGLGVLVVAMSLWGFRRYYVELSRAFLLNFSEVVLSIVVGLLVFIAWIHLDASWMIIGDVATTFVPVDAQGQLIWPLIIVRWIGAALLVPIMEELFWRGFLMRWVEDVNFLQVSPTQVGLRAMVISTLMFMLVHVLWLAAILAGLVYAYLYRRTGKLWSAVLAHAVTNGALGIWVVYTGQWQFW